VDGEGSHGSVGLCPLYIKLGVILGDSDSSDSRREKGSVDFRLAAIGESSLTAPLCIVRIEDVEHLQDPAMSTRAVLSAAYPIGGD